MATKKDVTANENEAISAFVQLQVKRGLEPRFCAISSVPFGVNERVVEIQVKKTRSADDQVKIYLWQNGSKHWRVWKIVSKYSWQSRFTQSQVVQAWVAMRVSELMGGDYNFAEVPADLHIDADYAYFFELPSA